MRLDVKKNLGGGDEEKEMELTEHQDSQIYLLAL